MTNCIKYFFEEPPPNNKYETPGELEATLTCAGIFSTTEARVKLGFVTIGIALHIISVLGFIGLIPGMNSFMRWGFTLGGGLAFTFPFIGFALAKRCTSNSKPLTNPTNAQDRNTTRVSNKTHGTTSSQIDHVNAAYGPPPVKKLEMTSQTELVREKKEATLLSLPNNLLVYIFKKLEVSELSRSVSLVCKRTNLVLKSSVIGSKTIHSGCVAEAAQLCKKIEDPAKKIERLCQIAKAAGKWLPKKTAALIKEAKQLAENNKETITFQQYFLPSLLEVDLICDPIEKEKHLIAKIEKLKEAIANNQLIPEKQQWLWGQITIRLGEVNEKSALQILNDYIPFPLYKAEYELSVARRTGIGLDKTLEAVARIENLEARNRLYGEVALVLAEREPYDMQPEQPRDPLFPKPPRRELPFEKIIKLIEPINPEIYKRLAIVRAKSSIDLIIMEKKKTSWMKTEEEMETSLEKMKKKAIECIFEALNNIPAGTEGIDKVFFEIVNRFAAFDFQMAAILAQGRPQMLLFLDCLQENENANLAAALAENEGELFHIFKRLLVWNPAAAQKLIPRFQDPVTQVFLWCEMGSMGHQESLQKAQEIALQNEDIDKKIGLLYYIFEMSRTKTSPTMEISKFLLCSNPSSDEEFQKNIFILYTLFRTETSDPLRKELVLSSIRYREKIQDCDCYKSCLGWTKQMQHWLQKPESNQKKSQWAIQPAKETLGLGKTELTPQEVVDDLLIAKFRLASNEFKVAQKAFNQIINNKNIRDETRMKALIECADAMGESGWLDRKVG